VPQFAWCPFGGVEAGGFALIEEGKVDEAIAAATPVVARVSTLGSRRIVAETRATVRLLGRYRTYSPAASFTSWSNQLLPAA
jgi:hypothetical protein